MLVNRTDFYFSRLVLIEYDGDFFFLFSIRTLVFITGYHIIIIIIITIIRLCENRAKSFRSIARDDNALNIKLINISRRKENRRVSVCVWSFRKSYGLFPRLCVSLD